MDKFFLASAAVLLLISILLLTRLLKVKKFSEKFIVILVAGTNIVLLLLLFLFLLFHTDLHTMKLTSKFFSIPIYFSYRQPFTPAPSQAVQLPSSCESVPEIP